MWEGGVDWQDVNPPQTDAGGFAGVVKTLLANQIRKKDVDILSGPILGRDASATGPEQLLEPDHHVRQILRISVH
jgi:hypothetical protein